VQVVTGSGIAVFGGIKFTQDDIGRTYRYQISEIVPDDARNGDGTAWADATDAQKAAGGFRKDDVIYSAEKIDASVTVSLDEKTGDIVAKVTGGSGDVPEITNSIYEEPEEPPVPEDPPEEPEKPEKPGEPPEEPDEPEKPDKPEKPPVPDKPEEPEKPAPPEEPQKPEEPPAPPAVPEEPQEPPAPQTPKTGEGYGWVLWCALMAASLIGMVTAARMRKKHR
ncbi:MAG: hypothetical protein IIU32_03975, partial [Firmicutes bacterium]|nr:hypothetical protein [Bacillota bacterium]